MSGLKVWLVSIASVDFGLSGVLVAALCFFSVLVCNACNRKWGSTADIALLMTTSGGAVAGVKAMTLMLVLEPAVMGAIAEDRVVYFAGGALATFMSLKQGVDSWFRAAGFARPPRSRKLLRLRKSVRPCAENVDNVARPPRLQSKRRERSATGFAMQRRRRKLAGNRVQVVRAS